MNIPNILAGLFSAMLLMVGADKFLNFLQPPCSLMDTLNPTIWKVLGVIQIIGAILTWLPKYRKTVAFFFLGFMTFFTVYHLINETYDIGGSVFMMVLSGLIAFNPGFLRSKK